MNIVPTRRDTLIAIGAALGGGAMYRAMTAMGHARPSVFAGPPVLSGARAGTRVIVLGAGLAGMLAAYELRRAGYTVRILEYQDRAGGRNISLRAGDRVTELDGSVQTVDFAPGNYFNSGPWRIPFHHHAILHYCKAFGVALEPFTEINCNALLHTRDGFDGRPLRYRDVMADFTGHVAELLAKATDGHRLDQAMAEDEREAVAAAMRGWGVLGADGRYDAARMSSRSYARPPAAGPGGAPVASDALDRAALFKSNLWQYLSFNAAGEVQPTMFQAVGGMDMIGKAFAVHVGDLITHNVRVTAIAQDEQGVTVRYENRAGGGGISEETADFCVCTIPLPILSQLDLQVSAPLAEAISAVPYRSSVRIGLEFKRRFWEQDESIYGGVSYTDLPIGIISYPSDRFFADGPAVLLGGYLFEGAAYAFTGMDPAQRIAEAVRQGTQLHPQYRQEFKTGVSMAWSRTPWTLGCCSLWSEEARARHYKAMTTMDGRVVLAGEHASYLTCWQEGALVSALSAIEQLHKRAIG